jgi:hypothetical protein
MYLFSIALLMSYADQKNKKTIVLPTLEQTKIPGIIILSY